nr:hypothetical protein [Tanacetum cinerariifolium]
MLVMLILVRKFARHVNVAFLGLGVGGFKRMVLANEIHERLMDFTYGRIGFLSNPNSNGKMKSGIQEL